MKLSAFVFSLFLASASAEKEINLVRGSISTQSDVGKLLLSKARQLDQNNNNNYYSWIQDYSIKFDGCVSVPEFEREEGLRSNLLAKFKLCPSGQCSSCPNAGEYIVDMQEFVESFQEAQQEANEYNCQVTEENCEYQCENGNYSYNNQGDDQQNQGDDQQNQQNNNNNNNQNDDEYCKYQCMSDAGMSFCNNDDDQESGDMKELSECRAMNEDNQNNNNNNGNYNNGNSEMFYVGAYCTSSGVYAATFTDSTCTKKAPAGTYEKYNYGYSLPTEALVTAGCTECKMTSYDDDGNNNNNNNYNGGGVSEMCADLYEQAGKCEKNVKDTTYQDTSGCEMIHSILPRLSSAFGSGPQTSTVLAWLFGVSCVGMGAYIFLLHKRVIRTKVNLASLGFGTGPSPAHEGVSA